MRIQKLGSELAVYLPRDIQRKLLLSKGEELEYNIVDNTVVLKKVKNEDSLV